MTSFRKQIVLILGFISINFSLQAADVTRSQNGFTSAENNLVSKIVFLLGKAYQEGVEGRVHSDGTLNNYVAVTLRENPFEAANSSPQKKVGPALVFELCIQNWHENITSLNFLQHRDLKAHLPKSLYSLEVSDCNIVDLDLNDCKGYQEIRVLRLERNATERIIPSDDRSFFKSLRSLYFSENQISNIGTLFKQDSNLTTVDLSNNVIALLPKQSLSGLKKLTRLNLSSNLLTYDSKGNAADNGLSDESFCGIGSESHYLWIALDNNPDLISFPPLRAIREKVTQLSLKGNYSKLDLFNVEDYKLPKLRILDITSTVRSKEVDLHLVDLLSSIVTTRSKGRCRIITMPDPIEEGSVAGSDDYEETRSVVRSTKIARQFVDLSLHSQNISPSKLREPILVN